MTFFFRNLIVTLSILLCWQAIVMFWQLPDYILPTPVQVFHTLYDQSALIFSQAGTTILETILGLILGILFGCLAGLLLAFFPPFSFWFLPVIIISQAIPTFAIAPLFVIWLGYGLASKIAITVLMIFFPVASSFFDGLRIAKIDWLDLAQSMNANKWRAFLRIQVPAALPSLATGIRLAAVIAPIGAIVGEWVGSSAGLGYLMLNANARMQIDMMFAALMVIVAMALVLYFSVDTLLKKYIWW